MSKKKLNIAVIGATGYTGLDLISLLCKHPKVKINYLCSTQSIGKKISDFDKRIKKQLPNLSSVKKINWSKIDLAFLSLPNGEAQKLIKKNYFKYQNLKFIDLSADFRINNYSIYKKIYNFSHKAKNLIKKSIYSVSEFVNEDVRKYKDYENISEIILFDSKGYEKSMSFDHNLLDEVEDHIEKMIAGNIKIEDVTNFKNKHYILDVSGSLESSKGVKDINKIDKFLNTVHNINS